METAFFVFTVIVLSVGLAVFLSDNQTIVAGQPGGSFTGNISGPIESRGLSAGPGLPQKDFK